MRIRQKKFILFLVIIGVFAYGIFQARNYILGPHIVLESPKDGQSFKETLISVNGKAKNVSYIALNGRPIYIDNDGNFNEDILLAPGLNIIVIEAKDKFGAKVLLRRQVTLIPQM